MSALRPTILILLLFLLPGIGLVSVSLIVPVRYFYRQMMWTRTEGLLLENVFSEDGQQGHSLLEFDDATGTKRQVKVDYDDSMFEGSDDKHFILYYNPADSTEFVMMNPGRYMIVIFFPFGLLLCYLGWPRVKTSRIAGKKSTDRS